MKLPSIFQVSKQFVGFFRVRITFTRIKVVEKRRFALVLLAKRNVHSSYQFARGRNEEQRVRSVCETIE